MCCFVTRCYALSRVVTFCTVLFCSTDWRRCAIPAGTLRTYASLDAYYDDDERRRRSRELDFGVWWRWGTDVYRLTWVEATGELITVRLSGTQLVKLPALAGVGLLGGQPTSVCVAAVVDDEVEVERLLEGWAEACGYEGSLAWVADRLGDRELARWQA